MKKVTLLACGMLLESLFASVDSEHREAPHHRLFEFATHRINKEELDGTPAKVPETPTLETGSRKETLKSLMIITFPEQRKVASAVLSASLFTVETRE